MTATGKASAGCRRCHRSSAATTRVTMRPLSLMPQTPNHPFGVPHQRVPVPMTFILWLLAVILVIAGIVSIFQRRVLWGVVLIIVGLLDHASAGHRAAQPGHLGLQALYPRG